jgi:hypothetical protein
LDDHATRHLALEPGTRGGPEVSSGVLRRTAKFVGDVLWWSFLTVIFASITIGIATEVFL